jgi:hypothetical protein
MLCAADVAAGGAPGGERQRVVDVDLVGVGVDGDLGGLAGVREADLDALSGDHDGATHQNPAPDDQGFWQAGPAGLSGSRAAQES